MKPLPNIIPLATPERGICGVCDGKLQLNKHTITGHSVETTLTHICRVTGYKVGECCRVELLRADDALNYHGQRFGICHPPEHTDD